MAISEENLKPCPFCGGEAKTFRSRDRHKNDGEWDASCEVCGAAIRMEYSEASAITAWNTRSEASTPCEGGGSGKGAAAFAFLSSLTDEDWEMIAAHEPDLIQRFQSALSSPPAPDGEGGGSACTDLSPAEPVTEGVVSRASGLPVPGPHATDVVRRMSLHHSTGALVTSFMVELALKLAKAEEKYGYSDGWEQDDWEDECRRQLHHHAAKGDPRDVAAYAAFCWHHGWSTALPSPPESV